jgi:hypothetical protein
MEREDLVAFLQISIRHYHDICMQKCVLFIRELYISSCENPSRMCYHWSYMVFGFDYPYKLD